MIGLPCSKAARCAASNAGAESRDTKTSFFKEYLADRCQSMMLSPPQPRRNGRTHLPSGMTDEAVVPAARGCRLAIFTPEQFRFRAWPEGGLRSACPEADRASHQPGATTHSGIANDSYRDEIG